MNEVAANVESWAQRVNGEVVECAKHCRIFQGVGGQSRSRISGRRPRELTSCEGIRRPQNSHSERSDFESPSTDGSGMVGSHGERDRVLCSALTQPSQFKILAVIAISCEKQFLESLHSAECDNFRLRTCHAR
jgi:hypothetical protein